MLSLLGLDPETYRPHALHHADRAYPETNCYADILIELIHARGAEPLAALGSSIRQDFEGDQWTFFKPAPEDLESFYGLDIHEMQPYRPLPEQIADQIEDGRTLIVELDSFFLPDTASTSYRQEHVKSSAVMEAIDLETERLRYFHNGGYYELGGEDYRHALRVEPAVDHRSLPPYTELARFDAGEQLSGEALLHSSRRAFARHYAHRPRTNPFERFASALADHLPQLLEGSHEAYHAYAFATVRMAGSAFEICASHVDWLYGEDGTVARDAFGRIVSGTKTLSLKLARRRAFDPAPALADLAAAWEEGVAALAPLVADDGS